MSVGIPNCLFYCRTGKGIGIAYLFSTNLFKLISDQTILAAMNDANKVVMKSTTADGLYILILIFLGIPFFAEYLHWQPLVFYSLMVVGIILMLIRILRGDD
jgi:hypothetical protein